MNKKRLIMTVYNEIQTDARVMRSIEALSKLYNITLIGLGKEDKKKYKFDFISLQLKNQNGVLRYSEFVLKVYQIIKNKKFDFFYGHDYYSAIFINLLKNKGIDIIYDAHELIIPDKDGTGSNREKLFYSFEKKAIMHIDLIIAANKERAELMKNHYGLKKMPLVINNISMLNSSISDQKKTKFLPYVNFINGGNHVIVYAGFLSKTRKIDCLFEIIQKEPNNCRLLIIGDGPDRQRLEELAKDKIPNQYCFTGKIPYSEMGYLIEKCDVGYLFYPNNSLNNMYSASNKVYEYASLSIPMISNENKVLKSLFEISGIGVANDNIYSAYQTVVKSKYLIKKNCQTFIKNNNWENEAKKLCEAVKKLEY